MVIITSLAKETIVWTTSSVRHVALVPLIMCLIGNIGIEILCHMFSLGAVVQGFQSSSG